MHSKYNKQYFSRMKQGQITKFQQKYYIYLSGLNFRQTYNGEIFSNLSPAKVESGEIMQAYIK